MMKITTDMMMKKHPCLGWTRERVAEYLSSGKTAVEILQDGIADKNINALDAIWGATQFLPEKINRTFAIWCAKQCQPTLPKITNYINVAEKYHAGMATKEELEAAASSAYGVTYGVAYSAAYWVAYWYGAVDSAAYWPALKSFAAHLITMIEAAKGEK